MPSLFDRLTGRRPKTPERRRHPRPRRRRYSSSSEPEDSANDEKSDISSSDHGNSDDRIASEHFLSRESLISSANAQRSRSSQLEKLYNGARPARHQKHQGNRNPEESASPSRSNDSGSQDGPEPYRKLWDDAMSELKQKESLFDSLSAFHIANANSIHTTLDNTINRLKERRWTYERGGEKKEYRELITKVLTVFNGVKGVGSVAATADPVIATPVFAGLCACVEVVLRMTKSDEQALGKTESVARIIQIYEATKSRYYRSPPPTNLDKSDPLHLMFKTTRELFTSILIFEASAAHVLSLSTGARAARAAVAWDDFESLSKPIEELDGLCQRYQKQFELRFQDTQWENSTRYLEEIAQNARFSRELLEVKEQREQDKKKILAISTLQFEETHNNLYRKLRSNFKDVKVPQEYHCPKDWFLDDANEWIGNRGGVPVFWLYGKHGMGKTSSTARVVQFLLEAIHKNDSNATGSADQQVAYFFISGNTAEDIIRSLFAQLARRSDGHLVQSLQGLTPARLSTLDIDWYRKEMTKLTKPKKTVLILDGLDECDDTSELLVHLLELIKSPEKTFRLLLTSNESVWENAKSKFPPSKCHSKRLDKDLNNQAILHYAYTEVKQKMMGARGAGLESDPRRLEQLEIDLVKSLTNKSQGMFLWIKLQIALIFTKNRTFNTLEDLENVRNEVEQFKDEPELNNTYREILERNNRNAIEKLIADTVYKWLLASFVPLNMTILVDATSLVKPDIGEELIRSICIDLIDIDEKTGAVTLAPPVRNFLKGYEPSSPPKIKPFRIASSHEQVLTNCLSILMKKSSLSSPLRLPKRPGLDIEWSLEEYAATFWPMHLREVRSEITLLPGVLGSVETFFSTGAPRWANAWIEVFGVGKPTEDAIQLKKSMSTHFPGANELLPAIISSPPNPLLVGCVLAIPEVLQNVDIDRRMMTRLRNLNGDLPAFIAFKNGSTAMIEALSKLEYLPLLHDEGNTMLHCAAMSGSLEMVSAFSVKKFIDHASKINNDGETAFHLAAGSAVAPLEKLELLVHATLDSKHVTLELNREDSNGATVLLHALRSPKVSTLYLSKLKEMGVVFQAKDHSGATALHYAVENSNASVEVVKALIKYGLNINDVDKNHKTALSYVVEKASGKRAEALVSALLKTVPSSSSPSTLHLAIRNSRLSMEAFKSLLPKKGKIISAVGREGQNVLHCAISELQKWSSISNHNKTCKRLIEIISYLITHNYVDFGAVDGQNNTALHYLARLPEQPPGVMAELLSKVSNVDAINKKNETALEIFLSCGEGSKEGKKAVEALIVKSGSVKSSGKYVDTVLHRALFNLRIPREIISLLLKKDAEIDSQNATHSTALLIAARRRSAVMVELLLDEKATVQLRNQDGASALHCAACSSDIAKIKLMAKDKRLPINQKDNQGKRPVHYGAQSGTLAGLKILKEHGAPLDITDNGGNTVLHHAVRNDRASKEILQYLTSSQVVSINHRNIADETPLMCAVANGSLESVSILLELGASVSTRNADGDTLMHCAVRQSKSTKKLLELLFKKEHEINAQNDNGETALHIAMDGKAFSNEAVCALLLAKASTNIKNTKGETPLGIKDSKGRVALHHAASKGSLETVKLLLKHGASFDVPDERGWTPLCLATDSGNVAIMKVLLEHDEKKSNVNSPLVDGRTALHIAAMKGDVPALELLLGFGAAINSLDKEKRTPLRRAVALGKDNVVRLLLEKGADFKSKDQDDQTPLHRAVTFGLTEVARILLDYEAPLNGKDTLGRTPAMLSVHSSRASTILLLLEHNAEGFPKLELYKPDPAQSDSVDRDERMKRLVTVGQFWKAVVDEEISKVNEFKATWQSELDWILRVRCEGGLSVLHLASRNDRGKVIKILVDELHIPVDDRAEGGSTALHIAAKKGRINAAEALITMGADVNAKDSNDAAPLHHAASKGELGIVTRLLSCANIKPNLIDKYLQTPLIYAVRNEKAEIVQLLMKRDSISLNDKNHKGKTALDFAREVKSKTPQLETMILEAMEKQRKKEHKEIKEPKD